MAMTMADVRSSFQRYCVRGEAMGVAALAIVASAIVGVAAQRQRSSLTLELNRLRADSSEVANFRAAFRPATLEPTTLPDSMATSVDRAERVTLAQDIATAAEGAGLRDVRVRFGGADSSGSAPPPLPQVTADPPTVASYTLVLECSGGLGAVLSVVTHLPPSIALERLSAVGDKGNGASYLLAFAVLERPKDSKDPKAGQHG
jgi:hypothetical protein